MWRGSRETVRDRGCCSIDAVDDARRVATALDLPHYVWNLEADFEADVVRDFEDGYAAGITPNPCVRCNQRIKFGVLLERARAAGATHLVTGHYARTGRRGALVTLHRARDARRDQAYVLHRLDQHQLQSAVFPLGGDESKAGVRAEAARARARNRGQARVAGPLLRGHGHRQSELRVRLAGRFAAGRHHRRRRNRARPARRACRSSRWGSEPGSGLRRRTPDAVTALRDRARPRTRTPSSSVRVRRCAAAPSRPRRAGGSRGVRHRPGRAARRSCGPMATPHPARIEASSENGRGARAIRHPGRPGGSRAVARALPR